MKSRTTDVSAGSDKLFSYYGGYPPHVLVSSLCNVFFIIFSCLLFKCIMKFWIFAHSDIAKMCTSHHSSIDDCDQFRSESSGDPVCRRSRRRALTIVHVSSVDSSRWHYLCMQVGLCVHQCKIANVSRIGRRFEPPLSLFLAPFDWPLNGFAADTVSGRQPVDCRRIPQIVARLTVGCCIVWSGLVCCPPPLFSPPAHTLICSWFFANWLAGTVPLYVRIQIWCDLRALVRWRICEFYLFYIFINYLFGVARVLGSQRVFELLWSYSEFFFNVICIQ